MRFLPSVYSSFPNLNTFFFSEISLLKIRPLATNALFNIIPEKFAETAFISEHPKYLTKTAPRIPTMAGLTEKEGTMIVLGRCR